MASEWHVMTLDQLGRIVTGRTPPSTVVDAFGGHTPFVTPSDMNGARIILTTARSLSASGQAAVKNAAIPKSAVMVSCIGSDMGKAAIAGTECVTNQQINSIIVDAKNSPLFVYYNLSLRKAEIRGAASGSAQPILNKSAFGRLEIELPPLEEQRAIAETLGALDDRIDNLRQTDATLEATAQALFKSWFVDFDGVPPEDMQESELGLIPKGWRIEEIGKLVQCVGGTTPSTKNDAFWQGGTHHWATPKDLSGLQAPVLSTTERLLTDEGVAHVSSGVLPAGTLLMSSRAPIGYLAIAAMPVAINQGFIAMPPGGVLSPTWLLFWAKAHMEAIKQKANGSTFMEISKAAFRPIKIIAPPNRALAAFDEATAPMLERVKINEQHIATLAALRDALLPRLMSGKLRVRGRIASGREAG